MTTGSGGGIIIASMLNALNSSSWRQTRGDRTFSPVMGSKSGVMRLDFVNTALAIREMRAVGVGHGIDDGNQESTEWKTLLQIIKQGSNYLIRNQYYSM